MEKGVTMNQYSGKLGGRSEKLRETKEAQIHPLLYLWDHSSLRALAHREKESCLSSHQNLDDKNHLLTEYLTMAII